MSFLGVATAVFLLLALGVIVQGHGGPPVGAAPAAAVTCLDGSAQGWCRVAEPTVRNKGVIPAFADSALVAGGRTTRYVAFVNIDRDTKRFVLAFEDVRAFEMHRYSFGNVDATACTFVAHDDGMQTRLKGFCTNDQGEGQPRSLVIWDSGWAYFGP